MKIIEKGQLKYGNENAGLDANLIALFGEQWLDNYLTPEIGDNYIRFQNGIQILGGKVTLPGSGWTLGGSDAYYSPITNQSLEKSFTKIIAYSATLSDGGLSDRTSWLSYFKCTLNQVSASAGALATYTNNVSVTYQIIGLWK